MNLLKQSQDPCPSPTVHDELETQQKLHCRKQHLSFTDVSAKLLVTVSDLGVCGFSHRFIVKFMKSSTWILLLKRCHFNLVQGAKIVIKILQSILNKAPTVYLVLHFFKIQCLHSSVKIFLRILKRKMIFHLLTLLFWLQTMRRHRNEVTVELRKVRTRCDRCWLSFHSFHINEYS